MSNRVKCSPFILLIQFNSILPTKYIITSTISVSAYYNRFVSFREKNNWKKVTTGIRRDRHLLFEVEMYLQKGCIMVSGVESS